MASSSSSSRPWPSSSSSGSSTASSSRPILGRLILLRHPNTEANAAGILQGSTDSPLTQHGERQLERLCGFFGQDEDGKDVEGKQGVVAGGWAAEELPVMIAHSPLERCARLARRVAGVVQGRRERASKEEEERGEQQLGVGDDDDEDGSHDLPPPPSSPPNGAPPAATSAPTSSPAQPSPSRPPLLYPSIDLQEKDFGPLECTRRGVHAGPSFPLPPPNAKRETDEQFRSRVRRSMRLWITKLVKRGREEREEWELEQMAPGTGVAGAEDPPTPPTLLVVTHGMFISTALRLFQPSISPNSPNLSVDTPVSFADNTGMFLLEVAASGADAGAWSLRLVRANWTPHLVGLTRPSKKAAGLMAAGADRRQRKLDGFFGAAAGKQEGKRKREDDAPGEEEQQARR